MNIYSGASHIAVCIEAPVLESPSNVALVSVFIQDPARGYSRKFLPGNLVDIGSRAESLLG